MESPESLNACFVGCNTDEKVWQYGRIQRGVMLIEQQQFDPTLRANAFVDVLVQVCKAPRVRCRAVAAQKCDVTSVSSCRFAWGARACRFVGAP
jgi:hypothetical protein